MLLKFCCGACYNYLYSVPRRLFHFEMRRNAPCRTHCRPEVVARRTRRMSTSSHLLFSIVPQSGPVRGLETLQDARRALLQDLPQGAIRKPHWRKAGWALVRAEKSGDPKDIVTATEALRTALEQEGWLSISAREARLELLQRATIESGSWRKKLDWRPGESEGNDFSTPTKLRRSDDSPRL